MRISYTTAHIQDYTNMSNFMENGPSNHNGETEQVWERPWTLEEMQKSSTNWSLAADSGLLHFLQDFSQRMLSKTHEIEKQLDGLIRDTKATDSCLHTVFNDFLMLSNTQFIENRVYDEEVEEPAPKSETVEKQPEQEKTREQKEAELIPKVQEAVTYGLKVLESAFEQLDIKAGNSESEDEEALEKVEPILEAKDLYVDRPLPYLIGSQAFMDQDDVGLGDLSSDEMSIDSDRDSVIESEDGEDDEQSDDDFDQDEEVHGHFKKKPSVVSYDDADEENEDEDSDIFGESDKDEDELRKETGLPSFADELAARIKGESPSKPETDRTSISSGPPVSQKKIKTKKETKPQVEDLLEDEDEMFKPPKMDDEEYSPFGGKSGLFSGGRGLFDDEDEGDLFSDAPKTEQADRERTVAQTTEPSKTKKIPTGAVSIFPENSLFGSPNNSDSLESKDNKIPVKPKIQAAPKLSPVGGGLFDDDDDEDDFFSGRTLTKSTPVGKEKQMPKKTVDLFGEADEDEDDDDGTMFSGKSSAVTPQQDERAEGEEETRPPEKKPPAGAISMFGPGTKNILVEGLKKRKTSISEESSKSEESVPPPESVKSSPVLGESVKAQSKSLFSDDDDSQIFPNVTKGKSQPTTPSKPSNASLSIFDDEEEEDLFASAPKTKSVQVKRQSLPPKKPVSSALFSDEEDQWMSSKPSKESPEVKSGGMKSSVSAPSRLPSVKTPQKDGLFDNDDDLFAATKESSKSSSQRVSLLFEDEDDKEPLFGIKPPANKTPSEPKASGASSLFESTEEVIVPSVAPAKIADEKKPAEMKPEESIPSIDDSIEIKKKPAGAVSLFGGIDILGNKQDTSKKHNNQQEELSDGEDLYKEGPPPMDSKGSKAKKTALSLFDDDDEDDDEEDENSGEIVSSKISKPAEKNTLMDHGSRIKSTGVFQDEELLFSHTQQRDNDPDVDLFATSAKAAVPSRSSVKPVAPTLFAEDDDDDLFGSSKPKAPPKVPEKPVKPIKEEIDKSTQASNKEPTSPLKSKTSSSRIGELQARLAVNPTSLLPGAVPRIPGAVSVIPGLANSSLPAASSPHPAADTLHDRQTSSEGGVSFDTPAQVNALENANKGRAKGAVRRRPQTRVARHLAAQQSEEAVEEDQYASSSTQAEKSDMASSLLPTLNPVSPRPSALTIPVTTPAAVRIPDEVVRPKKLPYAEDDLFDSDDLFGTASFTKPPPSSKHKAKPPKEDHKKVSKTGAVTGASKKDHTSSIFDSHGDDLFSTVKQKPVQKAKPMSFLDEDDDDIFGAGKSIEKPKMEIKPDIFQDKVEEHPKAQKKTKDLSLDASLFDDVDIFADLTTTTKPKEKKAKKKVETKSIFDDDMDDIFSTGTSKSTVKPPSKSKKNQSAQDPSSTAETGHSIFDDPLNAFGGN